MLAYQTALLNQTTWSVRNWQSATFVSTTSFTIQNNQTAQYQPGTSVQVLIGGNLFYSFILTSAYSSITTLTTVTLTDAILVSGAISVRVSGSDPNNNNLSRFFREVQVVGPNGLTVTNAAGSTITMVASGAGGSTVGWWQFSASNSGTLTLLSALNAGATKNPAMILTPGGSTPNAQVLMPITVTTPVGPNNTVMTFNQSGGPTVYQMYLDNVGENNATSRFWLGGPISGEVTLGPRDGTGPMNLIRLRAQSVQIENSAGGYGTGGEVWHSKNLNPAIYAVQGLSNTWTTAVTLPLQTSLNAPTAVWGTYSASTTNIPSVNGSGVIYTLSNVGDSITPGAGIGLAQQAFESNTQLMYLRFNTNNGGWTPWSVVYTAANLNPGAYVPIAGGVTVTSQITIKPGLLIGAQSGTAYVNFNSNGVNQLSDAQITVNGGSAGVRNQGAIALVAATVTLPTTTIGGNISVSGTTTLQSTLSMPNIGMVASIAGGSPQLAFYPSAGPTARGVLYLNATDNSMNIGLYNASGTFLGSAASFQPSTMGISTNQVNVNTLVVNGGQTTAGQAVFNGLMIGNAGIGYAWNGRTGTSSIQCNWDFVSFNGSFVGQKVHSSGPYYNFGQGQQSSWNDYGEGSSVFTNHRGSGSGGFRFRVTGDGSGFANVFFINSSGQAFTGSDVKLKESFSLLDPLESIRFVTEVRAHTFRWKHNQQFDFGFKAQDAQKVTKWLTWYDEASDQLNLAYDKVAVHHHEVLNHLLVRSNNNDADIQSLLHRVDQQDLEIASLKEQLKPRKR